MSSKILIPRLLSFDFPFDSVELQGMEKKTGNLIKFYRERIGMKAVELADKAGVTTVYLSKIENNHVVATKDMLFKIASALNVSLYKLLPDAVEPIESPRNLVPLISWVKAGELHEPSDVYQPGFADDWVATNARGATLFALRVVGDSMETEFKEGDTIIIDPSLEPQSGDFAVMKIDGEVTFKQVFFTLNKTILKPVNPKYETIEIDRADGVTVEKIGKVVDQHRKR